MENFIQFFSYISLSTPIINAYDVETSRFQRISVEQIEKFMTNEIFYIVNGGGTKDSEINKYNAFFVDFDCPKTQNGTYATLVEVKKFKDEILEKISSFNLMPTFIIDTRNGYHVYWCLEKNSNIKREEWQIIEDYLIKFLDADPKVRNPARNMRVPFTYWNKDKNNRYYVNIHTFNDVRYSTEDFIKTFNVNFSEEKLVIREKKYTNQSVKVDEYCNENIEAIKKLDFESMKKILQDTKSLKLKKEEYTIEELYSKINFKAFIGITSKFFHCVLPEHEDSLPSANIYLANNEVQLYKCFGCENVFTLTQIIQRLSNCSYLETLEFLSKIYDIKIYELEKIYAQTQILTDNIAILESDKFKVNYPATYKLIKKRIPHFKELLEFAKRNVNCYSFQDDSPIFWCTYKNILKHCKIFKNNPRISSTISLLSLLGIMHKLENSEIPKVLLKNAYLYREKPYHKRCNFYLLKPLNFETLKVIEEEANKLLKANIKVNDISIEFVLRTFSKEKAKEIYPQHKEKFTTSAKSNRLTDKLVKKILKEINSQKFIYDRELRTNSQWRKSINEILDSYDLVRVRANTKLKQKLGIVSRGYPFIICQNNMLEDGANENG